MTPHSVVARLLALFLPRRLDRELDAEIQSHIEMAVEENLRAGMTPQAARQMAARSFGPAEAMKQEYRDTRGIPLIEGVLRDFRFAIRSLRRSPGFTAIAVLTLTIGIGAATSTAAFFYEMVLRPFPYQAPQELVMVWTTIPDQGIGQDGSSYLNIQDWKERNRSFSDLALVSRDESGTLLGGEEPVPVNVARVSANLFPVLGASALIGRTFSQAEEDLREQVVVLSHAFWQSRFGGSPAAIGSTIEMESGTSQVIGVMPPSFRFPSKDIQLWTPHTTRSYWPQVKVFRPSDLYKVVARLRPGVTTEMAQADLGDVTRQILVEDPDALPGLGVQVVNLREQMTGQSLPLALASLFAAVIGMLLIACANVAGLLLSRGLTREREFALRTAIGAGRARLIQQLLIESLVLAAIAGVCGVALASFTIRVVSAILPLNLPHVDTVSLDPPVAAFSFGLALLTVMACGTIPALRLSLTSPNDALKAGGRSLMGGSANRSRRILVVAELALATALLAGTGLSLRSFMNVQHTDPGFQTRNVIRTRVALPPSYDTVRGVAFFGEALARLENLPGVVSAGAIHELFFQYNPDTNISVEGQPPPGAHQPVPQLIGDAVSGDYFRTMGVPLLRGRLFSDHDGPDTPRVTVINETMAREFFRGEDPVGKRFVFGTPNPDGENRWITVVGVVGDMRRQGLETAAIAQMFGPHAQFPNSRMDIVVRFAALESGRRPNELTAAVLGELRHIEKRAVISGGEVVAKELAGFDAWRTFQTWLLSVFSAIALLLDAMGVYGLLQQAVLQRRREIGVRIALGAQPADVRRLILRDAMTLVFGGLTLGVAASLAAAPVLQSLLYGVAANDPLTLGVTSALLFLSAAAATYFPVRRATRMDPITTLRED